MKDKILIATESESSNTRRITPVDLGILLSKMTPAQITEMIKSYNLQRYLVEDKAWLARIGAFTSELSKSNPFNRGNQNDDSNN
jgi:hypothetical protein